MLLVCFVNCSYIHVEVFGLCCLFCSLHHMFHVLILFLGTVLLNGITDKAKAKFIDRCYPQLQLDETFNEHMATLKRWLKIAV